MSLISKIQALITAANTKTGETDATLTDAVQTLVDGYGQGGGGRLPAGYTEYEYLESSGTQAIKTGVVPTTETEIEVEYSLISQPQQYSYLYGISFISGTGSGAFSFLPAAFNPQMSDLSANTYFYFGNGGERVEKVPITIKARIRHNKNGVYIYPRTTPAVAFAAGAEITTTYPEGMSLALFARFTVGGDINLPLSAKIYNFVARENGVLIRNMIPCMRDSDSVLGMYDIVNDVFYTNAGTGTFTGGALE